MMSPIPVWLFLLPFVAALLSGTFGWYVPGLARRLALLATAAMSALSLLAVREALRHGELIVHLGDWAPPLGIEWSVDPLGAFVVAIVAWLSFFALAGSGAAIRSELEGRETSFHVCAMLLVSGLVGMAVSADLFNVFVHLEVSSLSAYALVAAGGRGAPKAAMRYLLIGSLGATLYLLGVGFLYAATGSLNMADVAARIPLAPDPRLAFVGSALIVVGLGVKMGLFPLHGWMPDAYSRSPIVAAGLMAPLVTKVSAYVLIRVLFWVYGSGVHREERILLDVLCWAGAIGIVAGAALAAVQNDLRRILAYSSVSQMGLVALGVGLGNATALTGAMLHIANDALMKGALFLAVGAIAVRHGITDVRQLHRLRGRSPWLAGTIALAGMSLVGIPPLAGFFGKWYVLMGALQSERVIFAAAILVGSLGTAVYVFRIVEKLYFSAPEELPAIRRDGSGMVVAASALAAGLVGLGLGSGRVVEEILRAALPGGL